MRNIAHLMTHLCHTQCVPYMRDSHQHLRQALMAMTGLGCVMCSQSSPPDDPVRAGVQSVP